MDSIGTEFTGNEIDEMLVDGFTFDCSLRANDSGIDNTLWPMNQQINLSNNVFNVDQHQFLEQGMPSNGSNQLVIDNHAANLNENIPVLQTTYDSEVVANSSVHEAASEDLSHSDLSFNVLLTTDVHSKSPDTPGSSSREIFDQLGEVTSMNNVSQNSFEPINFEELGLSEDIVLLEELFNIEDHPHMGILENGNTYPQPAINNLEESPFNITLSSSPANQTLDCSVEDYTIWPMAAPSFNSLNHTSPSAVAEEHVPNMIPQIEVAGTSLPTGTEANMIQPNRLNTSQNQVPDLNSLTRANEIFLSGDDINVVQSNQPNTSSRNNSESNHGLMVNQGMRYNEGISANQPMGPTNINHQFSNSRAHQRYFRNGNDSGSSSNGRANNSARSITIGQPTEPWHIYLGPQGLLIDPRAEMFQRRPYDNQAEMLHRLPHDPRLDILQRQRAEAGIPQNVPNPRNDFPYHTLNRSFLFTDQYNHHGSSSNLNGTFNNLQASLPPLNIGNRRRNRANVAPQSNLANNHRNRSLPENSAPNWVFRYIVPGMSDNPATYRHRLNIPTIEELRRSCTLAPPGYTIGGLTSQQTRSEHDRVVGPVMVPPPPRGRPEIPVVAMPQAIRLQGSPDEISLSNGSAVAGSISPETPQSRVQCLQENGIADASTSGAILFGETSHLPGGDRGKRPMSASVSTDQMIDYFPDCQSDSSPSRTGILVYDEHYNALGLPVDPHFRNIRECQHDPEASNKKPRIDKAEEPKKPDEPDKS